MTELVIINRRLPLAAQIPPGLLLQFRGRTAIAAARVLPGFSAKLNVVRRK